MGVKESFDTVAQTYDMNRKRLIPCYDDFYGLPLEYLRMKKNAPSVLDLGAGTGLFSSFVREKYPACELTLIDISQNMLDIAKQKFGNTSVTYIVGDYSDFSFNRQFDCIISALSIHHLSAKSKQMLYKKCYDWLTPDGVFINADQILSEYGYMDRFYIRLRDARYLREGLSEAQMKIVYERMRDDTPSRVDEQLSWLREAGFYAADCIYKYNEFAVFFAAKLPLSEA